MSLPSLLRSLRAAQLPCGSSHAFTRMYTTEASASNRTDLKIIPLVASHIEHIHRLGLQKFQRQKMLFPQIWTSVPNIADKYRDSLAHLLAEKRQMAFAASNSRNFLGFIIGQYLNPPSVYDAGLTCMIREFHVNSPRAWPSTGKRLLVAANSQAKAEGATQLLVINQSDHSQSFGRFLEKEGLKTTSQWLAGTIQSQLSSPINVHPIQQNDVEAVVALSEIKRRSYEKIQPLFWKMAPHANEEQYKYLSEQITWPGVVGLVAKDNNQILGFVIGQLSKSEPFYTGPTLCKVDDFMVKTPDLWKTVGAQLLSHLQQSARQADLSAHMWIVSGSHDKAKLAFLKGIGLRVASEWHTGPVST